MTEKLSDTDERDCIEWILTFGNDFSAIFGWIQGRGVEQYIRDNGWGNAEWQADRILRKMVKAGYIVPAPKLPHFAIVKRASAAN
jgi:hypothetical protein